MRVAKWMILCVGLVVVGNLLVLLFADWLELLGVLVLMAAVWCAGFSPSWRKIHTDLVIEDVKPVDARRAQK